jgi:hypothetical protein
MLMQAEGLSGESLEAIARDGSAADARCNGQTEPRVRLIVLEHGHAEEFVCEALAALLACAKFSRLM